MQSQELLINSMQFNIERTAHLHEHAFVSMNIKNFKGINLRFTDTFGDDLLQKIETILVSILRPHESMYHPYGDVFELWLHTTDLSSLHDRIYEIDDMIYNLNDPRIYQSIFLSFGIYFPNSSDNYQHMRACADFCRNQSSDAPKLNTHIEVYQETLRYEYIRKQEISLALRKGFSKREFQMVLQPKVSLDTKTIMGAEALLRWQDATLHMVSTQELIVLSEQNGFIRELDLYMFEQVCAYIQQCFLKYHMYVNISVNISRYHFEDPSFFQSYMNIFNTYQIPAYTIEFEITETLIIQHLTTLHDVVMQMHHQGFRIALDDFGSGASSLIALRNLPISTIKLDRSLFLNENAKSRIIVTTLLKMAKQLHIETVCEGIENAEQESFLCQSGADYIQGYVYYPPLSIAQFEKFMFTK